MSVFHIGSNGHPAESGDGSSSHHSLCSESSLAASPSFMLADLENGETLVDLEREERNLLDVNERQEKRVERLQSNVYELIGFYLAFQGMVLTAMAQGTFLRCQNWWLPFILSLIASVAIILTVIQLLSKLGRCKDELDLNRRNSEKIRNIILSKKRPAKTKRRNSDPASVTVESNNFNLEMKIRKSIYPTVVILALITFTVCILIACRRILCEPGSGSA